MRVGYERIGLAGRYDPLAVGSALAASGAFDEYVVYERSGVLRVAADPVGRVSVRGNRIMSTWAGASREQPADEPARRIGAAFAAVPLAGWRAYGYAAFELAYLIVGSAATVDPDQLLFDAIVPATEITIRDDGVAIRCLDRGRLAEVADLVRASAERSPPPVTPCPVTVDADATTQAEYEAAVAEVVADIRRGVLDKVIVSRAVRCPFEVDLPATYLYGRRRNTPVRSFLLRLGAVRALGFSPEIVVEVAADGTVTSEPLAGTRAFGLDPTTDAKLRDGLLADAKEVYEHAVSVRAALDDLRTVCGPVGVRLDDFLDVKERGSVQHLASTLRGTLLPRLSCWDAFAAVFPAVTAAGIPKRAAYEALRRVETSRRGLYGGAVLTVDSAGTLDAALVLRALIDQGDGPRLRAGAGIVAMSTPAREYTETCEKLRSVADHLVPRRVPEPRDGVARAVRVGAAPEPGHGGGS
jgi:salicylate synthetase